MTKLLDRKAHALSDYGFTLGQWVLPEIVGMNKQAVNLYRMLGANLLACDVLTEQPLALKKVIPYKLITGSTSEMSGCGIVGRSGIAEVPADAPVSFTDLSQQQRKRLSSGNLCWPYR
jgi:hypothetical protein